MFKWIKGMFGKKEEPLVLTDPIKPVEEVKAEPKAMPKAAPKVSDEPKVTPTPAPKKKAAKKVDVNLESMNKAELLEYAKKHKVKANASMKKAEILEAIKNG